MVFLLHQLLKASAERVPDKTAVIYDETAISYKELDRLTDQLREILISNGVVPGDRVGIFVPKSLASVVSIFGILKSGASYVPLDPSAPPKRLAYIIQDCEITTLVTCSEKLDSVNAMFPEHSPLKTMVLVDCDKMPLGKIGDANRFANTRIIPWKQVLQTAIPSNYETLGIETNTAYILYTSGSTGTPKGVMITHRNSLTFVSWASDCVGLSSEDRVSSHAPLHFDLSIFDIFSSIKAGATIIIVPEGTSTFPIKLTELIERERISVWYSAPSVLRLLITYGDLRNHDLSKVRAIIFAGEVFPTKYLRELMHAVPNARYLNWYGPTETNVCTWYEVKELDPLQENPIPIGKACANFDVFAIDDFGNKVIEPSITGELYVRGPSLMRGYWGQPEKTAKVLIQNPFQNQFNEFIYRTGDMVALDQDGNYLYLGRRDGMVKTRGYRVELGEIESVLYSHPKIKEVAILPVPDEILGNRLRAVISLHEGEQLSREQIISYCGEKLPSYMIPDIIEFHEVLPKTSTGKTDRVALAKSYVA